MALAWASYQIHNIADCACAGNAGNVFPRRRLQRKPLVPAMHHGTCVTHVPWCMAGSLGPGGGGKRSRHSRRMRTHNFQYLARGPIVISFVPHPWGILMDEERSLSLIGDPIYICIYAKLSLENRSLEFCWSKCPPIVWPCLYVWIVTPLLWLDVWWQ